MFLSPSPNTIIYLDDPGIFFFVYSYENEGVSCRQKLLFLLFLYYTTPVMLFSLLNICNFTEKSIVVTLNISLYPALF